MGLFLPGTIDKKTNKPRKYKFSHRRLLKLAKNCSKQYKEGFIHRLKGGSYFKTHFEPERRAFFSGYYDMFLVEDFIERDFVGYGGQYNWGSQEDIENYINSFLKATGIKHYKFMTEKYKEDYDQFKEWQKNKYEKKIKALELQVDKLKGEIK